jgi:hypothetical protein
MVVQEILVQTQEIGVAAENIGEFGQLILFPLKKRCNKDFQPSPFG